MSFAGGDEYVWAVKEMERWGGLLCSVHVDVTERGEWSFFLLCFASCFPSLTC